MVEPPGEHTASFMAPGCWFVSSMSWAVPAAIWAAYRRAFCRGRPQATPPSARPSKNRHRKAGPHPATALPASMSRSSSRSRSPAPAMPAVNFSRAASETRSLAS